MEGRSLTGTSDITEIPKVMNGIPVDSPRKWKLGFIIEMQWYAQATESVYTNEIYNG